MFETYKYHKQDHSCPIKEKVMRVVAPKVISVINNLTRLFSTTETYKHFKNVTKNCVALKEKLKLLREVDIPSLRSHFEEIMKEKDHFKNGSRILKFIAFHLGQSITLMGQFSFLYSFFF